MNQCFSNTCFLHLSTYLHVSTSDVLVFGNKNESPFFGGFCPSTGTMFSQFCLVSWDWGLILHFQYWFLWSHYSPKILIFISKRSINLRLGLLNNTWNFKIFLIAYLKETNICKVNTSLLKFSLELAYFCSVISRSLSSPIVRAVGYLPLISWVFGMWPSLETYLNMSSYFRNVLISWFYKACMHKILYIKFS